ncbi:helix-turn-helix domain-containing protein [Amycolatopsis sp. 195334CR]|uniref:helix-turn-helix domain-containing protein n=1 Tax=Amycolatopsis sp. 195334CR TaxID=2814588 RepID=UPI001A8FA9B6|nr:helix-turn-helix transcriptional regulator [Amycolatopsis sp. 195334CR]MBN6037492.1 helix-turn-helix domain-containing protein [Amycolatopsis sp. 195334CR]
MDSDIGRRIREIRSWRQLTLREAGPLAGITHGYLGKIERGEEPLNSRHVLENLCRALGVAPTDITGAPYAPSDPVGAEAHAALRDVEVALSSYDLGVDPGVQAQPWPQLAARIDHLNTVLRPAADYAEQGKVVPDLLEQLHAAYVQKPKHRRAILIGLLHLFHSATVITKGLGSKGYPVMAARAAEHVAGELGESDWIGFAAWLRGHALGSTGRAAQYALSVRTVDEIAGGLDSPDVLQAAGMLHLNAALASAAKRDADMASTHLDEAEALAARLPEGSPVFAMLHFGADNVRMWRVSIGVEMGEPGRAVELSRGVRPDAVPAKARQGMYLADVGRALIADRRTRDEGVAALIKAEEVAPQRIRNNLFAREAVAGLLHNARRDAVGRELRGLAWRMGVAPTG